MLREHALAFRRLMMIADIAILCVAYRLGCAIVLSLRIAWPLAEHLSVLPLWVLTWVGALHYVGVYDPSRVKSIPRVLWLVCQASLAGFLLFSAMAFGLKATYLSRLLMAIALGLSMGLLSLMRVALMIHSRHWRSRGHNQRHILVIGTGRRAQEFIRVVEHHREWGLRIVGLIDDDLDRKGESIAGYPVLGTFADTEELIHQHVVDEVVVMVPRSWLSRVEPIMQDCEREGIRMHMAVDYVQMRFAKARQNDLDGLPLLTFETTSQEFWHLQIKRGLDILISSVALVFCLPLCAMIALAIRLTSPGPVLFRQQRCGLNGRPFTFYKFRTMVADADGRLEQLLKQRATYAPGFKLADDPRMTALGRFLRKSSLDELPQFWNVLSGDMSLVGPRPSIPWEVDLYESWQRRRLRMRPGLTCLWQVNGRNKITDFRDRARLDLDYIDNWCLLLDWKILLRTVPVVLFGIGAK